jgi:hypothetical protein
VAVDARRHQNDDGRSAMTTAQIAAELRRLIEEAERRLESENRHENDRQMVVEDLIGSLAKLADAAVTS